MNNEPNLTSQIYFTQALILIITVLAMVLINL